MASFVHSAGAAPAAIGASFENFYPEGLSKGKEVAAKGAIQPMGHALPQLSVRASGPGCDIRWEDFNYPPVLRLIHFDITELQIRLRKTVRLLNLSFVLTTFACAVNFADTAVFVFAGAAPGRWLLQSTLHLLLLPPTALGVFYLGYRGVAAPEPLLAYRFQFAQLCLGFVYVFLAIVPHQCVNGLIRLASLNAQGMEVFQVVATVVESLLWALNACMAVLSWAQVRRFSIRRPDSNIAYGGPPVAKGTQ